MRKLEVGHENSIIFAEMHFNSSILQGLPHVPDWNIPAQDES